MSLSGALSNALSGLTANSRAAALVASNISNATTESYGRRTLDLSSRPSGTLGGVRIDGVHRNIDAAVLADRRLSDAQTGFANDMQAFASEIEGLVGESGVSGSLTGRFSAFENALLSAASDPSSTQRLQSLALSARDFTGTLNQISSKIQGLRSESDRSIATQVDQVNSALVQIADLNTAIAEASIRDGDPSSLMDERQRVIDSVAEIIPLRTAQRENGAVAVYAASGTVLIDPSIRSAPAQIGFDAVNEMAADMTVGNGQLSGLSVDGHTIDSSNAGPLGGGTLGAQFHIRDTAAVDLQAVLDGVARDLVERFEPGGPDGTLAIGDPGLFTDAGSAFDPLNETGLAGRISLNDLVTPGDSGVWRLRDGLGAVVQGDVGDAQLLKGYSDALESLNNPASTSLNTAGTTSFGELVADFHSAVSAARIRADGEQSFSNAQNVALQELELSKGVDTDAELQDLMLIEQHYAANARVMTVVDDLMQTLLSI